MSGGNRQMTAYYNEFDRKPAAWLRELALRGLIMPGVVDETSITALTEVPDGFTRAHFFAGLGGWDYALRLAGWPADRPVWTGSCPCQPFSSAGKQKGTADARHLWPDFLRLIAKHRPTVVFGEQVSSSLGREWLAGVRADLEALGYEVGAADLCAAGTGAPHIRQRLYWVAYAEDERHPRGGDKQRFRQGTQTITGEGGSDPTKGLAYAQGAGHHQRDMGDQTGTEPAASIRGPKRDEGRGREDASDGCDGSEGLGNPESAGLPGQRGEHSQGSGGDSGLPGPPMQADCPAWNGPTGFIGCSDGTRRAPLEPSFQPLAHGVPARVGRLRGYGNSIVPQLAAAFIQAVMPYLLSEA